MTETLLDRIKNACRPVGYPDEYRLIRTDNLALLVAAVEAANEVRKWGEVETDPRIKWLEVQVDRDAVEALDEAFRKLGIAPEETPPMH